MTLKKLMAMMGVSALALSMAACSKPAEQAGEAATEAKTETAAEANAGETTITTAEGEQSIAVNPSPLAVYDMTAMQNLTALGVVAQGLPEITPERMELYNFKVADAPEAANIGTLTEPNLENLHALQPKAVFFGSRMAEKADALKQVAPTYNLTIDTSDVYKSSKQQLADFGRVFNKVEEAAKLQADIDAAIEEAKKAVAGKGNGLAVLVNGNKISAYGKNSRYGFLHTTLGIPMADEHIKEARHGQPISFEYIQKTNPDWIFVLDRAAAVGEEGEAASVVLDNPLVKQTTAGQKGQIVYLSADSYLAFGGYYQWLKDTKIITDAFNKASN
ncbi:ABC transporter substrate-binding protein [Moraxella caviae]|uniref:ABC transporter substrate-binding protein n=1 Tax=Moraxella caviae TaxID=34060 RepID=A0A1T0A848_9GAMM|nr:ABC transporter substrate-binding protein [Moraxella caviae]OOR91877.1 ABC transporter substrate-binding protein [Moraxella caviae]STZ09726.1 Uncharacterized ABC transporter solute-binding protein yclQ precursor [Moraxella caviae]